MGLGKAIENIYLKYDKYNSHLQTLRDFYIEQIEQKIPEAKLNGDRKTDFLEMLIFRFQI